MQQPTCFHEADPTLALPRRALAEGVGTMLLVIAASGSGLAAVHAFPQPGFALPLTALAIAGALVGLIVAFGPVSGGHFNPLITLLQWFGRERSRQCTLAYVAAQLAGGVVGGAIGAWLWHAGLPPQAEAGRAGFWSEALASGGLMLVVFGCARSGRVDAGPFAVGAWLVAAILATPTTSFANPAVVLGALVTSGPVALTESAGLAFIFAQLAGAAMAYLLISSIYPRGKCAA